MKTISVILPVCNAGERLQPMLDSLCAQEFQDFEVLLMEEDSTACSTEAVRRIQSDSRFHCFVQEESGTAAAYNHGMQLAEGKYIAFLTADDRIHANYLSVLYAVCEQENADAVCCAAEAQQGGQAVRFSLPEGVLSQRQALEKLLTGRGLYAGMGGKLYRRARLAGMRFSACGMSAAMAFQAEFFARALCVAVTQQTVYHHRSTQHTAASALPPDNGLLPVTEQLLRLIQQRRLSAESFYNTISYPMRYAWGMGGRTADANEYLRSLRRLMQQNRWKIWCCPAFPRREALLFLAFSCGYPVNRERRQKHGSSALWTQRERGSRL